MKPALSLLLASALVAGAATAQPASFTVFGTACSPREGTLAIGNTGLPVLGSSFSVDYEGPNLAGGTFAYHPALVVGFSAFTPGLTIPAVFAVQPAGCNLHVSLDIVIPMPLSPVVRPAYESRYTFSIPARAGLQGATFHVQWMTVYTRCGIVAPCEVRWLATSQAATVTIGT